MSSMPCLIRTFPTLAATLLALLLDTLRFFILCLRPTPALVAENLFYANSWRKIRNVRPHPDAPTTRPALLWSGSVISSIGEGLWSLCNRRH